MSHLVGNDDGKIWDQPLPPQLAGIEIRFGITKFVPEGEVIVIPGRNFLGFYAARHLTKDECISTLAKYLKDLEDRARQLPPGK